MSGKAVKHLKVEKREYLRASRHEKSAKPIHLKDCNGNIMRIKEGRFDNGEQAMHQTKKKPQDLNKYVYPCLI